MRWGVMRTRRLGYGVSRYDLASQYAKKMDEDSVLSPREVCIYRYAVQKNLFLAIESQLMIVGEELLHIVGKERYRYLPAGALTGKKTQVL